MLKITVLAIGLFTVAIIAPSARSTTFQNSQTRSGVNGELHAEKLVPIKKSVKLSPTIIKDKSVTAPLDRKPELSPANKESQPVKSLSQREFEDRNWLRQNERPISIWDNSANGKGFSGFGNFHNFNR